MTNERLTGAALVAAVRALADEYEWMWAYPKAVRKIEDVLNDWLEDARRG